MGPIETTQDIAQNLTTNTVRGAVFVEDILSWIDDYCQGKTTRLLLWDFTRSTLTQMTSADLAKIAEDIPSITATRSKCKSALVFSADHDFGMGRMFCAFLEAGTAEHKVFREVQSAKRWLGVK